MLQRNVALWNQQIQEGLGDTTGRLSVVSLERGDGSQQGAAHGRIISPLRLGFRERPSRVPARLIRARALCPGTERPDPAT